MRPIRALAARQPNLPLLTLALLLPLFIALALALMPPPTLLIEMDGGMAHVTADRRWTVLAGDCLQISWTLAENQSLHIDGATVQGEGSAAFCPRVFQPSPLIAWRGGDGAAHLARLDNMHLPDVLVNLACLTLLSAIGIVALLLLWTNAPDRRLNWRAFLTLLLAAAIAILLTRFVTRAMSVEGILSLLKALFLLRPWQFVGALLGVLLYAGLAGAALRHGWNGRGTDGLALLGFAGFILLLYLPFGFGAVAHFEQWIMRAYLEGMPFRLTDAELVQRPFLMLPGAAGLSLTSESFHGLNLVFALILWGKLTFCYMSLRHIGARDWCAFLIALLVLAYPVDIALLSLRSIAIQTHILFFLTAVYLMLRCIKRPTRLGLLALWLSLALCVGMSENAYGLILVAPIWWWRRESRIRWKINLTIIWYLAPGLKAVYMALLWLTGRSFYRSGEFFGDSAAASHDIIAFSLENYARIYHQSFAAGWVEAIETMGNGDRLPHSLAMLILAAAIAWFFWRGSDGGGLSTARQSARTLALGLLLILPAAVVVVWIPGWGDSFWHPYFLTPLASAIAVFSALLLITSRVPDAKWREAAVIGLCLLLLLPAISRLVQQQAHYVKSAHNKAHFAVAGLATCARLVTRNAHHHPQRYGCRSA